MNNKYNEACKVLSDYYQNASDRVDAAKMAHAMGYAERMGLSVVRQVSNNIKSHHFEPKALSMDAMNIYSVY